MDPIRSVGSAKICHCQRLWPIVILICGSAPSKGSISSAQELDMMNLKFSKASQALRCFLMSKRIWRGGYVPVVGFNNQPRLFLTTWGLV